MECIKALGCPMPECIDPEKQTGTKYALMDNLPVGTPRQPPVEKFTEKDIDTPRFTEFVNVRAFPPDCAAALPQLGAWAAPPPLLELGALHSGHSLPRCGAGRRPPHR